MRRLVVGPPAWATRLLFWVTSLATVLTPVAGWAGSLNVLTLLDGKELIGTVLTEKFQVQTPYCLLTVDRANLGSLLLDPSGQGIEGAALRNGDRVSGFVLTNQIDFREQSGAIVHLRKEKVKNLAVEVAGGEHPPGLHQFRFRNGDLLTGRITNRKVLLLAGYGTVEIRTADIARLDIWGEIETQVRVTLSSGKRVEGRMRDEDLSVELEIGGSLAIYLGNLAGVTGTSFEKKETGGAGGEPGGTTGMVFLEGGEFLIGSNDGEEDERPARRVSVSPFYIDRTEVTNEQYRRFVQATGHRAPRHWKQGSYAPGTGNWPVVYVTCVDAADYARWAQKRLPTEEEWEAAARGTDGRTYPWGESFDPENANCKESGLGTPSPVGKFKGGESPCGALDLAGNVWEWTDSWYQVRKSKVFKGGSFRDSRQRLRSSYRSSFNPNLEADDLGFRCARSARGR
ncbi:MAG: formylglycine-generating enzyme family protein [Candidatus Riflebacteria bacterium]|nr:formylglycine-generating enzyme family protein [Candidatus Riflebacteria bacterium]